MNIIQRIETPFFDDDFSDLRGIGHYVTFTVMYHPHIDNEQCSMKTQQMREQYKTTIVTAGHPEIRWETDRKSIYL